MEDAQLRSLDGESLVKIRRRCGDELRGLIGGVGRKWLLLHLVRDLDRDGLTAIRLADIRRAVVDHSGKNVAVRSLRARGLLPEPVAGVRLDRTSDLLDDLQRTSRIVTIHPERRWPGTCHLGVVVAVDTDQKRCSLHEVTPSAKWDGEPTEWRLRDVRRIDVGDSYATNIFSLAGPVPLTSVP